MRCSVKEIEKKLQFSVVHKTWHSVTNCQIMIDLDNFWSALTEKETEYKEYSVLTASC